MAAKVFISYRRDDSAGQAGRIQDRLEREFGRDLLFMDVDAIPLGMNFVKVLHEEVAKCGVLLAVIGPNWLDARDEDGNRRLDNPNDFVRLEIAAALQRDIPVIPILLDGARVPKADQLPKDLEELGLRNGLDVRHASFHYDMDKLIRGLKGQSGHAAAPPASPLPPEAEIQLLQVDEEQNRQAEKELKSRQQEQHRRHEEEELQRLQNEEERRTAEEELQRRQQEEQSRHEEDELQRRQQAEQRRQEEEELLRPQLEEQCQQAEEEPQQLLQVAEESHSQQEEPSRKPNEEPAWKLLEPPGLRNLIRRHWPAMAAVVIAAAVLVLALALTLGGVFRMPTSPPSQQASTNFPAAVQPAPVPAPQPAQAPEPQPTQAALPAPRPAPPPVPQTAAKPAPDFHKTLDAIRASKPLALPPIKAAPTPLAASVLLRTLTGHEEGVSSVAFSPDGRSLASGSWDHTIKLWDFASGELLRTLIGHADSVESVAFSPDGRTLASGGGKIIELWNTASGKLLRRTGHTWNVRSVAFSPDGRTLASGSEDNTIKLWDAASARRLRTLTGHTFYVARLAFSPDGRTLASGSLDETIKLWNFASGQLLRTLTLTGYDAVWSVAFSPDGRTLASGSYDHTVKLWDTASEPMRTLTGHDQPMRTLTGHEDGVSSVAFSPDGRTLASGSHDHTIKLWDVSNVNEVTK